MWTTKIPEIPGLYFFQGWESYDYIDKQSRLRLVEVYKQDFLFYRCGGEIINPHEMFGLWKPIRTPLGVLPDKELISTVRKLNTRSLCDENLFRD